MREVSDREATRLIATGAAGWYAPDANPPILHDKQIVVSLGDKNYLCSAAEITVTNPTRVTVGGLDKVAFDVTIPDGSPLVPLFKAELDKKRPLELPGVDVPVLYGGDRQGI